MRVPRVAFLVAGLTTHQRTVASMGIPPAGIASNDEIETAWNARLKEIAEQAIPGSIHVGDLQASATGVMVMVTYEIEETDEP